MARVLFTSPRVSSMLVAAVVLAVLPAVGCQPSPSERTQPFSGAEPIAWFEFDENADNSAGTSVTGTIGGTVSFVEGLEGQALSLTSDNPAALLTLDGASLPFDRSEDFSVQAWIKTTADPERRMVVLSQKEFGDNSLASQKHPGWVFYISDGTWAWSMGSGDRRLTYERDNGEHMPINDGRWHQLSMTYDSALSEVRLFYDGNNKVVYKVGDGVGFDFTNSSPLILGWAGSEPSPQVDIVPAIYTGAENLQAMVDAFNGLGAGDVEPDDLVHLITDPRRLLDRKANEMAEQMGADGPAFLESMQSVDFEPVSEIEAALMNNPYTIHQVVNFMQTAPTMKIYSLVDGEVTIDESAARAFTERERLYPPDFDIDGLAVWDRVLSSEEVLDSHSAYLEPAATDLEGELTSITAGVWNIWHGGKHVETQENGGDSRVAIANLLREENADVVMMQETYSSGDFIAAELGYYFATTVDWDYLNQGANISVLSRYPIVEIHVQEDSPFMNVGAKIAISDTQDLYVMSNWYGMDQFPDVFDFHQSRFAESDTIPTLFGGDFNALPHTDGGDSPASRAMLDAGFTDAFRSLYPDVQEYPGHSHRSGRRIDQLYHKGAGLQNTSTRIISTRPGGFPSDHFLILSTFDLDYSSVGRE